MLPTRPTRNNMMMLSGLGNPWRGAVAPDRGQDALGAGQCLRQRRYFGHPKEVTELSMQAAAVLLNVEAFRLHAQQSLTGDGWLNRRGSPLAQDQVKCERWYVILPGLRGNGPVAIPTEVVVESGLLPRRVLERQAQTQWAAQERSLAARSVQAARKMTAAQDRAYWASKPGLWGELGLRLQELGKRATDAAKKTASSLLWAVGGAVFLGILVSNRLNEKDTRRER